MANEFDQRVEGGVTIWTCRLCANEFRCRSKPRDHVCIEHENHATSTPVRERSPGGTREPPPPPTPFSFPPPPNAYQFGNSSVGSRNPFPGYQSLSNDDATRAMQIRMLEMEQHRETMAMMKEQNELMMKNMMLEQKRLQMEEEKRQQMEQIERDRTKQLIDTLRGEKKNESKPIKCPRWSKDEEFRAFQRRLQHWDSIEKSKGKYLQLLESLQQEGRKKEKERIELEEQNKLIEPESENVVAEIITKMEKWFGKPKLDQACDAWRQFKEIKRGESEPVDDFLLKFETSESNLKCSAVGLPQLLLALQLVESMNISDDQKRNILANVKMENHETIYDDIKTSIRLLKGTIVEGYRKKDTKEDDEVNYLDNKSKSRSRSKSRQRSKSYQRHQSRSFRNSDDEGQDRNKRYSDRGRSKDRQPRDRYRSKERNSRDRHRSRDRSYSRNRYHRRNERQFEDINVVFKDNPNSNDDILKDIHDNLDKIVIDCGATKTVAGRYWMDNFLEIVDKDFKEKIKYTKENRIFRFGNSVRYPSKQEISIPFKMGQLESVLHVSVVDANIPLLLGRPDLKKLGLVINFENDSVFTTKSLETFSLAKPVRDIFLFPSLRFLQMKSSFWRKQQKRKKSRK